MPPAGTETAPRDERNSAPLHKPLPLLPEPPSREVALRQCLYSVAQAEVALARMLHAQADHLDRLGAGMQRPVSFDQVLAFQRSLCDLLGELIRVDEVQLRKLTALLPLCESRPPRRYRPKRGWKRPLA